MWREVLEPKSELLATSTCFQRLQSRIQTIMMTMYLKSCPPKIKLKLDLLQSNVSCKHLDHNSSRDTATKYTLAKHSLFFFLDTVLETVTSSATAADLSSKARECMTRKCAPPHQSLHDPSLCSTNSCRHSSVGLGIQANDFL